MPKEVRSTLEGESLVGDTKGRRADQRILMSNGRTEIERQVECSKRENYNCKIFTQNIQISHRFI